MNLSQITDPIRQVAGVAAVLIFAVLLLKAFGVSVRIPMDDMKLIGLGILAALISR